MKIRHNILKVVMIKENKHEHRKHKRTVEFKRKIIWLYEIEVNPA